MSRAPKTSLARGAPAEKEQKRRSVSFRPMRFKQAEDMARVDGLALSAFLEGLIAAEAIQRASGSLGRP